MLLNFMLGFIITLTVINIILCLIAGAYLEAVLSFICVWPLCWVYSAFFTVIAGLSAFSIFGTVASMVIVGAWFVSGWIYSYTIHPAGRLVYLLFDGLLGFGLLFAIA